MSESLAAPFTDEEAQKCVGSIGNRIYLAGSILGGRANIDLGRQLVSLLKTCKPLGKILTEDIFDENILDKEDQWKKLEEEKGNTVSVCERDLEWLDSADCLVAEVSQPSLGVGGEVFYALFKRKIPVLCLYNKSVGICSKMISENTHPLLSYVEYNTLDEMSEAVSRFFGNSNQIGRVFTIEGGDGSGKQTQTEMLVERLEKEGYPVKTMDFPHDKAGYGDLIRELLSGDKGSIKDVNPLLFSSLYALNRHDVAPILRHWLRTGNNVILDRYMESNWGHQASKYSTDTERIEVITTLLKFERNWLELPMSERVIYLDLPPDEALKAMRDDKNRVMDMHEKAGLDYRNKVRESFVWCANRYSHWDRLECVQNGTRVSKKDLHEQVFELLRPYFVNISS